jgi:hypothetical protein
MPCGENKSVTKDHHSLLFRRADEQLRQEREVFEQSKSQEARWFRLRLVIGYSSVAILVCILIIASCVLYYHDKFPSFAVNSATVALFTDVIGSVFGVWKFALNPESVRGLTTVTNAPLLN